jgi:hypothetical protein
MAQPENPPPPPAELTEDEEEEEAYRQMIRQELAAVAQWAAWRAEEDEAFRRKVALARAQKAE